MFGSSQLGGARLRNGLERRTGLTAWAAIVTHWADTLPSRAPDSATSRNHPIDPQTVPVATHWARLGSDSALHTVSWNPAPNFGEIRVRSGASPYQLEG